MLKNGTMTIELPRQVRRALTREARLRARPVERVAVELLRASLKPNGRKSRKRIPIRQTRKRRLSPLEKYLTQQADPNMTLEQVWAITSKIPGSMSDDVIAEREERL